MTETITADEVEAELPDSWWAENDGDTCVRAYAGYGVPRDVAASASIEATDDDEMWEATWNELSEASGYHEPVESKTGVKERVISWVAEKAEEAMQQ